MIPISIHLENKNVLVVGSGKVAQRKIRQYLKEKANVTVLSLEEYENPRVKYIQDSYCEAYLENQFMVYAATNDQKVNHQVIEDCNRKNILCGNAKYDKDASFYSMNAISNDVGMIGLSTNQKIPYSKPILDEMLDVLERNKERLQMIADLRPYIIQYTENVKDYIVKLYNLKLEYLKFIHQSTLLNQGYIILYHPGANEEPVEFKLDPCITLTALELEELKPYLIFKVPYQFVPLVLSDGIIYQKMVKLSLNEWQIARPIVDNEEDVKKILSIYRSDIHTVYIMHPRKDNTLKNMIIDNLHENERLYDFTEDLKLEKDEKNRVILFLVTHGKHYLDVKSQIDILSKFGYQIHFLGSLLDHEDVIRWIEEKVR